EAINGGPLADGSHTLHLQAQDAAGAVSPILDLVFEPDTTRPAVTLDLDPASESDPVGDRQTTFDTATLVGQTGKDSPVVLGPLGLPATSDATGRFTFSGIGLALGNNAFTARVTDLAGNEGTASVTFARISPTPAAPVIAAHLSHDTAPGGRTNTD